MSSLTHDHDHDDEDYEHEYGEGELPTECGCSEDESCPCPLLPVWVGITPDGEVHASYFDGTEETYDDVGDLEEFYWSLPSHAWPWDEAHDDETIDDDDDNGEG